MSYNRSCLDKKPNSKTTIIPGIPDTLTKNVASNLGMKSQAQLAMVSTASHQLFKKQTAANRLLSLVAKHDLTETEFEKLKENTLAPESKEESVIKNPILLAVKAFLEKDPSLALIKGSVTDLSGRTRHDSPLEYAYWSGNFFVCQMILEKVKGNPEQEKKAFAQIRAMQDKVTNYDVVLKPTFTAVQTAEDMKDILLGFKAIILVSTNTLISSDYKIPVDAILLQEKHEGIMAYRMVNDKIKFDKAFDLRKAVKKIQGASIKNIVSYFPKEKSRVITEDNNADLFKKLCLLCGYSMPIKPTLIKYFNAEGDPKINFWGDLNGRWQLIELNDNESAFFAHIVFPLSGSGVMEVLPQSDITMEMYAALKRGHTVSQYDLSEFNRKTVEFLQKYPGFVPEARWKECDADGLRLIGMTQKYFPAWIAQLWCSATPFECDRVPNFWNVMSSFNSFGFTLYGGGSFFDAGLGEGFSLYKYGRYFAQCVQANWCADGLGGARGNSCTGRALDAGTAMLALCELTKAGFGKISEQLLAFENSQGISSKANQSPRP